MNLRLVTSWGLLARLSDSSNGELQRELDLHLNSLAPFETVTFKLTILADLNFTTYKDISSIEHKVVLLYSNSHKFISVYVNY